MILENWEGTLLSKRRFISYEIAQNKFKRQISDGSCMVSEFNLFPFSVLQNQLSGNLLRKFKNSNGWQKLWVVFTNFSLFFYKSHQVMSKHKSRRLCIKPSSHHFPSPEHHISVQNIKSACHVRGVHTFPCRIPFISCHRKCSVAIFGQQIF